MSRSSRTCSSPPHAFSNPPDWAKELLRQQQANAIELKHLQSVVASLKSQSSKKPHAAEPESHFTGHKRQYHLNNEVMDKIDEALAATSDGECTLKLNDSKNLPLERNKHILLACKRLI